MAWETCIENSCFPTNFFTRQYSWLVLRLKAIPDSTPYQESHHVFPKSIFGDNEEKVKVSYRHHVVLHYLLWRGYQVAYGDKHNNTIKAARAVFAMLSFNTSYRGMHESYRKLAKDAAVGVKLYLTEEHRAALSCAQKGRAKSQAWLLARKGHKVSEDTKLRISEANKGRESPMKGKKHSDETRRKISAKNTGKPNFFKGKKRGAPSEALRTQHSLALTGRAWSEARKLAQEIRGDIPYAHRGKPWSEARRAAQLNRKKKNKE